MPLLYWALEDIQQTQVLGGFTIETDSDVACHMWLRWTYSQPQSHPKPVLRRGLLIKYDARFCFVDFCDVEQEEEGDTYHHTFYVPSDVPPAIPPTSDWPFYEPWGTFLTENYPWEEHGFLGASNTSLAAGKMTLYNDAQLGINIATLTPSPKPALGSGTGIDLYLSYSSPAVDYDPTYGWLSYIIVTKKDPYPEDVFDIEPIVARGSTWGPWGDHEATWDNVYAFDMGQGPGVLNFTERWKRGRALAGKSTNPTGWYVDEIFITNEQLQNPVIQEHTVDYLGCYLFQASPCNLTPWLNCETRYFYFWATNAGEPMKSTSPTFSKHYLYEAPPGPTQHIFYSDPHPEFTSVDGQVNYNGAWTTWPVIRAHPGTHAYPSTTGLGVLIRCGSGPRAATYYWLYRSIMLFDCSSELGSLVSTAKFHFWGTLKTDTYNVKPTLNLYQSNPASNNNLVPTDYSTLDDIPLATPIEYDNYLINAWQFLTLNADGIALINNALAGDGIVKLGLREGDYDGDDNPPFARQRNKILQFNLLSTDDLTGHRPYLEIY